MIFFFWSILFCANIFKRWFMLYIFAALILCVPVCVRADSQSTVPRDFKLDVEIAEHAEAIKRLTETVENQQNLSYVLLELLQYISEILTRHHDQLQIILEVLDDDISIEISEEVDEKKEVI